MVESDLGTLSCIPLVGCPTNYQWQWKSQAVVCSYSAFNFSLWGLWQAQVSIMWRTSQPCRAELIMRDQPLFGRKTRDHTTRCGDVEMWTLNEIEELLWIMAWRLAFDFSYCPLIKWVLVLILNLYCFWQRPSVSALNPGEGLVLIMVGRPSNCNLHSSGAVTIN